MAIIVATYEDDLSYHIYPLLAPDKVVFEEAQHVFMDKGQALLKSTHNICFHGEIRNYQCFSVPYLELCYPEYWATFALYHTVLNFEQVQFITY